MVESFRHLETPAPPHERRRPLLIHVVKAHQPQPADLQQIAETIRRNQTGAGAAPLDYGVCRDGRAMDQLLHAVAIHAAS